MKVTSLNNFLLRTYVLIHFFIIGGRLSFFFYSWVVNLKSLGITDIYNALKTINVPKTVGRLGKTAVKSAEREVVGLGRGW